LSKTDILSVLPVFGINLVYYSTILIGLLLWLHTCIPAYLDHYIPGSLHTWITGSLDHWITGSLDTCIPAYLHTCPTIIVVYLIR